MGSLICITGEIQQRDLDLLREVAGVHGFTVTVMSRDEILGKRFEEDLPKGFFSFLPPSPDLILELFANLPLGSGECLPLFQRVADEVPSFINNMPILGVFETPLTKAAVCSMLLAIVRSDAVNERNKAMVSAIIKYRNEKLDLVRIGTALSSENDLQKLLELILTTCREILCADAGSIYIRERKEPGGGFSDTLSFKVAQNDSVDLGRMSEYSVPINSNYIAGYVALTARSLNIDDVERLDDSVPYRAGRVLLEKTGYRIKSMLTIPLKNHDGEVVGVLQLINRKNDPSVKLNKENTDKIVRSFSLSDEEFVQSVASQAAVSIERAQLYENIKALFEGFLGSSIAAIDERDRVTSGHSKRVMGFVNAFLDAAEKDPLCPYYELASSPDKRKQFQFAALLHDIGKIGVPEYLLTKENKLGQGEFENIMSRMDYVELLLALKPSNAPGWGSIEEAERDRELLKQVNECGRLSDELYRRLDELKRKTYVTVQGQTKEFLSKDEWKKLSVRSGNLTPEERELINSHAVSTFRILSKIPWTGNLARIPEIAAQHHERTDGSGYPGKLKGDQILIESRILAVIDIYEALVAQDRPYKPRTSLKKALQILREEVDRNHLDKNVVSFFIEKEIYRSLEEQSS